MFTVVNSGYLAPHPVSRPLLSLEAAYNPGLESLTVSEQQLAGTVVTSKAICLKLRKSSLITQEGELVHIFFVEYYPVSVNRIIIMKFCFCRRKKKLFINPENNMVGRFNLGKCKH